MKKIKKSNGNKNFYMLGKKWRALADRTKNRIKKAGYSAIIWRNGDFEIL